MTPVEKRPADVQRYLAYEPMWKGAIVVQMANRHHLVVLSTGAEFWNSWRNGDPNIKPDLSSANLSRFTSFTFNLVRANLRNADLTGANLIGAFLTGADLTNADLTRAHLRDADFTEADLTGATLMEATFSKGTRWPKDYDPAANGAIPIERDPPQDELATNEFTITFGPELSSEQVRATLTALANYYRASGGVGLEIDFDLYHILIGEPVNA